MSSMTEGSSGNVEEAEVPASVGDRLAGYREARLSEGRSGTLPSPWEGLNEVVAFISGQVLTVGSSVVGASSLFATQWAAHAALNLKLPTLMVSGEVSAFEVMDRIVANAGEVPLSRLRGSSLSGERHAKGVRPQEEALGNQQNCTEAFRSATSSLEGVDHLRICDGADMTIAKLRSMIKKMQAQGTKPALLVLDRVWFVSEGSGPVASKAPLAAQVGLELRQIAMEFDLCLLLAVRIDPGAESREPDIFDFKGPAGAIVVDSDVVLILHSEVEPETGKVLDESEIEVIVAKNRNGARDCRIKLIGQQHYARFVEVCRAGQGV